MGSPDHPSPSAHLILDSEFEDIESFGSVIATWDLDFRQLDAGPLRASAAIIGGHRNAALRVRFNRRIHQRGHAPPGCLVLGLPDQSMPWCGARVTEGHVINFSLSNGFDGVTDRGFTGTLLLLDQREMEGHAAHLGLDVDLDELTSNTASWSGEGLGIRTLKGRLARIFRTVTTPEGQAEATRLLNCDATSALLGMIVEGKGVREDSDLTSRRRVLRTALERLEDSDHLPMSIADLCRSVGVSSPTLYRSFQEEFDISPKQYLKARSLSGAHRELLRAAPGVLVVDIANQWGFWHMGQFARDYRRHFGELPSETLSRA